MKKVLTVILIFLTLLLIYTRFIENAFFDTSNIIIKNEKVNEQINNFKMKIIANSLITDDSLDQIDGQVNLINESGSDAVIFSGNNFTQAMSDQTIDQTIDKYKNINVKHGKFYYFSEYESKISPEKSDRLAQKLDDIGFINITNKSRLVSYRGGFISLINTTKSDGIVENKPDIMNVIFYTTLESEINQVDRINDSKADFAILVKNPKYPFKIPFLYDPFSKVTINNQVVNGLNSSFDQPFRFGSVRDAKNIIFQKN